MKIKNYDTFFFNKLAIDGCDSSSENASLYIAKNIQLTKIELPEHSIEFYLPSTFAERTDTDKTEADTVLCYGDDKCAIDLYFHGDDSGPYQNHLSKASSGEMTQPLKYNNKTQAAGMGNEFNHNTDEHEHNSSIRANTTNTNFFRHVSNNGNTFQALSLVELEHTDIIFDFHCPNSCSDLWLDIFIEIINSIRPTKELLTSELSSTDMTLQGVSLPEAILPELPLPDASSTKPPPKEASDIV